MINLLQDKQFLPLMQFGEINHLSHQGAWYMLQGSRDGAVVEHSPPTNVARVRFPVSASYVG